MLFARAASRLRVGGARGGAGAPPRDRDVEDLEEAGIDVADGVDELAVAGAQRLVRLEDADRALDVGGVVLLEGRGGRAGRRGEGDRLAAGDVEGALGGGDAVHVRQPAVVGQLVADEQQDEEAGGEADGQAADVDGGVELVVDEVADRDREVVAQHR